MCGIGHFGVRWSLLFWFRRKTNPLSDISYSIHWYTQDTKCNW